MSKSNVCLVGLSKQFTDNVCQQLAIKLDMFYANIEKLLEYELVDMDKIEEVCGGDYLVREQISIIKRTCSYDNTLINIEYQLLNNNTILNTVKQDALLIYIRLNENRFAQEIDKSNESHSHKSIDKDLFEDRDFLLKTKADICVDCEELDDENLITKIIENIVKYYS